MICTMRTSLFASLPLLAFSLTAPLVGCSDPEDLPLAARSPEQLVALAEAAGVAPAAMLPRFGGRAIIAGPRVVEVMPLDDGEVIASLRDATGEPIVNATLEVQVRGADGQPHAVPLRYKSGKGRYEGKAPDGVTFVPGRVDVTVRPRGGDPTLGYAEAVPVAPVADHGGQVVMVGPHAPEVQLQASGRVVAHIPTEDGELPDGELYIDVPVEAGEPVRVELDFDDDEGAYVAELDDDVMVVPGPVEVIIEVDDVSHHGRVVVHTVAPAATLGGEVVVVGDYGMEVAEVDGQVHAVLYDVRGRPLSARPPRVKVHIHGHPRPVLLRWHVSLGVYAAPLPPHVDFYAAPVRIDVRHGGRVHHGRVRYRHGHHRRGHRGKGPPPHARAKGHDVRVHGMSSHGMGSVRVHHSGMGSMSSGRRHSSMGHSSRRSSSMGGSSMGGSSMGHGNGMR